MSITFQDWTDRLLNIASQCEEGKVREQVLSLYDSMMQVSIETEGRSLNDLANALVDVGSFLFWVDYSKAGKEYKQEQVERHMYNNGGNEDEALRTISRMPSAIRAVTAMLRRS